MQKLVFVVKGHEAGEAEIYITIGKSSDPDLTAPQILVYMFA